MISSLFRQILRNDCGYHEPYGNETYEVTRCLLVEHGDEPAAQRVPGDSPNKIGVLMRKSGERIEWRDLSCSFERVEHV
jgi:hypothetical protein